MTRRALAWIGCWLALTVAAVAQEPPAQGSDAEAEPLPPWQRVLEGDDAERAEELASQINELSEADRYEEAVAAAEELFELRRKVQGRDHWQAIIAEWEVDALRRGALVADERAAWREALRGADEAEELQQRGRYADAAPLFQKALDMSRRVLGEDHPHTAARYNNVASNLSAQGKYAEAQPLFQKALQICRKVLGEEHPHTATTYNSVAGNLSAQGKYAEAEPLFQKALAIRRKVLGEEHPNTAMSYNNVAGNLDTQGKYAEAEPLFQKALAIRRKVLGEEHPDTAQSYNTVAGILKAQGKYAEAEPLYRKALEICRNVLGEEHPHTATTYNSVAGNLSAQGKYAEAEPLYQKALAIRRKVLGEEHPNTARSYDNVAGILTAQGKYAEAEPLFRKALEIFRKMLGEEHPGTAQSYNNVAYYLGAQGRYAEAQPLYQKALQISRKVLGEEHPHTATSYNNVAFNLDTQGKYAEAAPLFQKALNIRRRVLGEDHPNTAGSYNNLAFNLTAQDRYSDALGILHDAMAAYEAARLRISTSGLERAAFAKQQSPFPLLAALEARQGHTREAWRALESDLARGLLDESSHRAAIVLTASEEQKRQELLAELARIEPLVLALVIKADRTDAEQAELNAVLADRATAEAGLADLAAILSQRQVASFDDVQAALPSDAALIAWVDVAPKGSGVQEHWGCVLRSSGLPVWERLPGTGPEGAWTVEDSAVARQLREALSLPATLAEVKTLRQRLWAQRIEPLEPHLEGVRRLFVAGVHEMAGVPLEVLTDRFTVSYTPSGTQLAKLKGQVRPTGPPTLLALGDAVFQRAGSDTPAPTALPPGGLLITQVVPEGNAAQARLRAGDVLLAYAGTELESVEQLGQLITAHEQDESVTVSVWRETEDQPAERQVAPGRLGVALAREPAPEAIAKRRQTDLMLAATRGKEWQELPGTRVEVARLSSLFDPDRVTVLVDSEASEERLEELLSNDERAQFRYLHLATHGEANPAMAFESALILAQDDLSTADDVAAGEAFYDGRLTANEILEHWKLDDAELVTLSSCESGLGRAGGGEGFLGFAQALLLAGSRSVCLSLWEVDDTATALLMDRIYQNLLGQREGLASPLPKAEALAEAKRWLRSLTVSQATDLAADLSHGVARGAGHKTTVVDLVPPTVPDPEAHPYEHPYYWAAFVLIGDAE